MSRLDEIAADMAEVLEDIGLAVTYDSNEYSAILADPRVELDLQSGGFMPESDFSLKVRRADLGGWTPAIRDVVTVRDVDYVVKALTDRPSSPMLVLHIARK
ncbi:hypothetical protein EBZ39_03250 [bacterium]|nr:hypothetical protein [bacterium]